MLFNSISFLFFFPIVTILYFLLPHRFRWFFLLSASCLFYMAFIPAYICILFITIVIDYAAGIYIEATEGATKRMWLITSIISTCLVLFIFKYINFFNANMIRLAQFLHWNYPIGLLAIILPIGLSFHTFQSLSYVIEVYRGNQKAEKHFGIYALYVMFYPQLVAGPIERPQHLLHQFREPHSFDYRRVTDGLKLMAWGMFKKVVIADRLAAYVNIVYGHPHSYTGLILVLATVFFAFQIYADFSGYSDIAIGAAQVMGFTLMTNFNRPYFSTSISEFWKRWHISLSTWFRDYVYISLGGNRVSRWKLYRNLFITFALSGLWHGANWTYVLWGCLNWFYLAFSLATQDARDKIAAATGLVKHHPIRHCWKMASTFALICFSWVLFRASNLHDVGAILANLPRDLGNLHAFNQQRIAIRSALADNIASLFGLAGPLALIAVLLILESNRRTVSVTEWLNRKPLLFRWGLYYAVVYGIAFLGVTGENKFIYFQF